MVLIIVTYIGSCPTLKVLVYSTGFYLYFYFNSKALVEELYLNANN